MSCLIDSEAVESGSKSGDATDIDPDNASIHASDIEFLDDASIYASEFELLDDITESDFINNDAVLPAKKIRRNSDDVRDAKAEAKIKNRIARCRQGVNSIAGTLRHTFVRLSKMSGSQDSTMHLDIEETIKWAGLISDMGEKMLATPKRRRVLSE